MEVTNFQDDGDSVSDLVIIKRRNIINVHRNSSVEIQTPDERFRCNKLLDLQFQVKRTFNRRVINKSKVNFFIISSKRIFISKLTLNLGKYLSFSRKWNQKMKIKISITSINLKRMWLPCNIIKHIQILILYMS